MTEPLILPLAPGDPQRLGGHQLIGLLGHGGMGRVYLGISPYGGQVAVKVMHPQYAGDTAFRERFKREAETAMRVSGRFTARVLDSGVDERTPWLVTEYIPGPTLAQLVSEYGPLPDASVRALAAGLAQALSDIHSRQIVHRDLKPANVILSVTGPRVIDFGIARALDGTGMTATDELLGTVNYMSPEHLAGGEVTGQSDVYSLGAVLVYASAGKTPQRPITTDAGNGRWGTPGLGDVPPGVRALIARCLRPDPALRATLAEVIGECGHSGIPRLNDWLPQPAAAFVRTRAHQQQGSVTTLLNGRKATPPPQDGPGGAAEPASGVPSRPAGALAERRHRYRALSARMATASEQWPLVRQAGLRRWSALSLLLSVVALAEVASRTSLAERRGPARLPWLASARNVQDTIRQFTSWLPDPVAAWSQTANSAAGVDDRLAAVAGALVVLTAIARRTRRTRAHQVALKTVAAYAGSALVILVALRLVQTGFAPLIHIVQYLGWWAVAVVAVAAAVVYPLAGPAR
ncbi:MAG TPA: serine/threonine-protein kinase [Streptosporangiaceae bacterium]|nr:serine/threonine-protein kinase [Streptosporangiaceae bacterium]